MAESTKGYSMPVAVVAMYRLRPAMASTMTATDWSMRTETCVMRARPAPLVSAQENVMATAVAALKVSTVLKTHAYPSVPVWNVPKADLVMLRVACALIPAKASNVPRVSIASMVPAMPRKASAMTMDAQALRFVVMVPVWRIHAAVSSVVARAFAAKAAASSVVPVFPAHLEKIASMAFAEM